MLPSFRDCQKREEIFNAHYLPSTFDQFWEYKLNIEKSASILDDSHLDKTAEYLYSKLLTHPAWGLADKGVPSPPRIVEILTRVRPHYETIRQYRLGNGKLNYIKAELLDIYEGLSGITHTKPRYREPDDMHRFNILGKSKVLMFIWGQTPGFDVQVRKRLISWKDDPAPYTISCIRGQYEEYYTAAEFYDLLETLDHGVVEWEKRHAKLGKSFKDLDPFERPIGRIIDIIYWTSDSKVKRYDPAWIFY